MAVDPALGATGPCGWSRRCSAPFNRLYCDELVIPAVNAPQVCFQLFRRRFCSFVPLTYGGLVA